MAVEGAALRNAIESLEGQTLVRRFTDELTGQTTLELAAISIQQEDDVVAEAKAEARMRALYRDEDRNDVIFHAAETARLALMKTCNMFETTEQPSALAKIVFGRKTARATANEAVRGKVAHGFIQLNDYIGDLEVTWRSKQGRPAQRFRSLCGSLDAHKNAFSIFPSQNNYASALCGSLKLIIGAAVNHDEIAETISETVTDITEKAARAANTLLIVRTRAMRQLFSQLYAQVFLFYRDAIEWYMKSKTSRFLGSFNEKIKGQYEKAAIKIEGTVTEMYRQTDLAHYAWSKIQRTEQERREEVRRQRQQTPDSFNLESAGRNVQALLLGLHKSLCIESSTTSYAQEHQHHSAPTPFVNSLLMPSSLNRAAARILATTLEQFIVGSEGHSFLNHGRFWLPAVDISSSLHDWIGVGTISSTLWISSPDVTHPNLSSSRAAALNLLVAAWQAEMPIISHFCERPRFATLARDRDMEKVGLIVLVYSLITQLLQFTTENDTFEVPSEKIEELDGLDRSWPQALSLLATLLRTTPHLRNRWTQRPGFLIWCRLVQ